MVGEDEDYNDDDDNDDDDVDDVQVSGRMKMMFRTVEELREKTWELDTSTR